MTVNEAINILGLSNNYTKEMIEKKYRKKALLCHPDLHPLDSSKFIELGKAKEVLLAHLNGATSQDNVQVSSVFDKEKLKECKIGLPDFLASAGFVRKSTYHHAHIFLGNLEILHRLYPRAGSISILNEMHNLVTGSRCERQSYKEDLLEYWQNLRKDLLDERHNRVGDQCVGMIFGLLMALFTFYRAIYLFLAFFVLNLEDDIVSAAETGAPIAVVTLRLSFSAAVFMIGLIPLKFSYDFFRFYTGRQINEMDAFMTILSTGSEAQNPYGLFSGKLSADENIEILMPEQMV